MIYHVSIGVRDVARAKLFYDAALDPLGYERLSEDAGSLGYGRKAVAFWINKSEEPVPPNDKSGLHVCFDAPPAARAWMHSMPRRSAPEDATTGSRACAPITAPTIMPPSPSTPTATASRHIAANRNGEGRAHGGMAR